MAYELFYSPGACSLAAHIVLEEVQADFTLHLVSTAKRDTAREPFLSINPKGRVPVLRIPGEPKILTELPAILRYVAQRHPDIALVPVGDPLLEARCEEWLAWLAGWVHGVGFGLIWRPERFSADPSDREALAARGRQIIQAAYSDIEQSLGDGRTWSVGERFSIVDPFLLVLYRWGNLIGIPMRDHYPSWANLTKLTVERPAVARALKREDVSIEG